MKTTFIYSLIDPRTGEVKYIGKANKLKARYRSHLNKNDLKPSTKKTTGLNRC